MSSLSSVEAKLPPGFRFYPRDEELICDYLMKWISGCPNHIPSMIEVDLNKCEPWDIPETACVGGNIWYFYSQRDKKYATGSRKNRATVSGYWKATGKDRHIIRKGILVGMRKTLVFHQGRAPKGTKTDWVMHEFRLEGTTRPGSNTFNSVQEDWVLCRVLNKKRSEVKQGTANTGCSYFPTNETSSSINTNEESLLLMEPYNNLTSFDTEQVPCFSIYTSITQNQPWPSFDRSVPHELLLPNMHDTDTWT